jgi:hypothetical protein
LDRGQQRSSLLACKGYHFAAPAVCSDCFQRVFRSVLAGIR